MGQFILSDRFGAKDWDLVFVIDWKCFETSPEVAILSPGGLDLTRRAANVSGMKRGVFGGPAERAYAKVSDEISGDIVSFISCRVYRGALGIIDGEFAESPPPTQLPHIEDKKEQEFYEWYWTSNRAAMREMKEMQVPHVYIQALGTDPVWQRHGAATMLLKWVFEFAAKAKLGRCALQAAPFAVKTGFYEKFGFRVSNSHTFIDENRFPGREGITVVTMIKDI